MKKNIINKYSTNAYSMGMITLMLALMGTGCATKKAPTRVYATPVQRTVSPINQAISDAPRTQPGKIMDPDALTYAQVPSRILYLPGDHNVGSRKSPRQEVAYNLVPVDRIGAIQAEATPEFGEIIVRKDETRVEDIIETTYMNDDGSTSKGKARRLGVLNQSNESRDRAMDLLKKGEDLRWDTEIGWVGFVVEKKAKPYTPKISKQESEIKQADLAPKKEAPKIEELDKTKTEDLWKEEKKNEVDDLSLDIEEKETIKDTKETKKEVKEKTKDDTSEEIELSFE